MKRLFLSKRLTQRTMFTQFGQRSIWERCPTRCWTCAMLNRDRLDHASQGESTTADAAAARRRD